MGTKEGEVMLNEIVEAWNEIGNGEARELDKEVFLKELKDW